MFLCLSSIMLIKPFSCKSPTNDGNDYDDDNDINMKFINILLQKMPV